MKAGARYFLLPALGALSEVAAFAISQPFADTLKHPGVSSDDPLFHYTLGTQWGMVNHWASGALLCGTISCVLAGQRKGWTWGLLSGLIGVLLGGLFGAIADTGSDMIGVALDRRMPSDSILPIIVWCALVPSAYALSIAIAIGPTIQRLRRAAYTALIAFVGSFFGAFAAGILTAAYALKNGVGLHEATGVPEDGGLSLLRSGIPMWETQAVIIGIVIGLMIAIAEHAYRAGSLRLILGRNESKEWNLDHSVNRIGSAENVEISVRGLVGVAPVHAQVVRQDKGFALYETGAGSVLLNGQPTQQAWLSNGDMISLGQATLVFNAKGAARPGQGPLWESNQTVQPQTFDASGLAAQAVLVSPQLVDSRGNVYPLRQGTNSLGRETGNSITLSWDTSVSRRHAEIVFANGVVQIQDIGSSNGTLVNGTPIRQATILNPGDMVQLGGATLMLQG